MPAISPSPALSSSWLILPVVLVRYPLSYVVMRSMIHLAACTNSAHDASAEASMRGFVMHHRPLSLAPAAVPCMQDGTCTRHTSSLAQQLQARMLAHAKSTWDCRRACASAFKEIRIVSLSLGRRTDKPEKQRNESLERGVRRAGPEMLTQGVSVPGTDSTIVGRRRALLWEKDTNC